MPKSDLLYEVLLDACDGKAAAIVKSSEKRNGMQVWCRLKREYEGDIAGRYTQMLISLLSPPWTEADGKDFGDVFTNWLASISQLETQRGKRIDGDILVATVLRHSRVR